MASGMLQPAARPMEPRPRALSGAASRAAPRSAGPSRWRMVLIGLAVGALIGVGVAAWMHMSQEPDESPPVSPVSASILEHPLARRAARPGE
jgi:hypothetical protein